MTPSPGIETVRQAASAASLRPGVYQMLDDAGTVLYVGKAKHLRHRLGSYTNTGNLTTRILNMVMRVAAVRTIETENEAEALLLEASLIKTHRPRYNVLLKDDKSFPYVRVATDHPFPRIEKYRGAQTKPGEYFGPFANVAALNTTMALLQKIFLLRPCADSYFKNRTRPCLQYQIKRCSAPCVGYIGEAEYAAQIAQARDFLRGKHRDLQAQFAAEMQVASDAMDYERAALWRDRIRALTQVQQEQGLQVRGLADADVIGFARSGPLSAVSVHCYRGGSAFGQQIFHPRHDAETPDDEVRMGFLAQFYQAHTPPGEVLVGEARGQRSEARESGTDSRVLSSPLAGESNRPCDLVGGPISEASPPTETQEGFDSPSRGELEALESAPSSLTSDLWSLASLAEALSLRAGHKVELRTPERGDKKSLLDQAMRTADQALVKLQLERTATATHLARLQELFRLSAPPERIEVYDNSHIRGSHAVGAFIVATPEGFDKKSYRTFTIREATPGDDYGMMREVMRRRVGVEARGQRSEVREGGDASRACNSPHAGESKPSWVSVGGEASKECPPTKIVKDDFGSPSRGELGALEASPSSLTPAPRSLPSTLFLIDGGAGQLSAVLETLAAEGVSVPVVAIAKGEDRNAGREWFHVPGQAPFQLPVNDPTLHYLQRLRDEAHRFAIGRHRGKRSKALTQSALDDIPGIGATRKRALLRHFGSRADVATASREELQRVPGISKATAQVIYDHFHG